MESTPPPSRPGITARLLVLLVYGYRGTIGPFLSGHCRFEPTCSQYMIDAIRKHGAWRGGWRGLWRIARCNPWGGCGYDPA
jgi:putative membrane protein insertion efficiency factor